ncbi:MAG: EAL domain-containing protein [Lachnospiraceae bacterium]
MDWIIEFDIAAVVITVIILGLFLKRKSYPSKVNRMYLYLMTVGMVASVLDIISVYAIIYAKHIPLPLNRLINMLFLLSMNAVTFVYYFYITAIIDEFDVKNNWHENPMRIVAAIDFLLIALSPVTGWVFYFDENRQYCSGPLKSVIYVIALFVLFVCLMQTIRNRKILTSAERKGVYLYTVSNLIAVIVQCVNPKLLITNFAISIAFLIMYVTLQRPEDKIDSLTQLENKAAFLEELNREVYYKKNFFLLVVKMENLAHINNMYGITQANSIIRLFAKTLLDASRNVGVYRISGSRFVYIGWSKKEIDSIIRYVETRINNGFELNAMEVQVKTKYCVLWYPEHGKDVDELEKAIQYCLKYNTQKNGGKVIYADSDMLEAFKRKDAILDIVRNALDNRTFEVYYQPIFNWRKNQFDSAEALIRLRDEKFGFISPDEFIPMAEKNGMIIEIGEYVIEEVCKMIQQTEISKYGMEHIHINLSGVQCMQKDLNEKIQYITQKYGIHSSQICFEITETAAIHSDAYLTEKIKGITDDGFSLALDDYGSGFATFGYLLHYPFSIVKFDKEIVWQAAKQKKAAIALNHLSNMMKEIGLVIVAEGVETEEQAEFLKQMGCDLLQGYLYAKPMPKDTLIQFLKN